jgi:AcrR family transcriptional regulator
VTEQPRRTPRTRRATGSYPAADAKRAAIIEAATRLFAEHGFHDTTVAAVAKTAGTSQTGLLHHFKDKDTLLLAVLRAHDRASAKRFDETRLGVRTLLDGILAVLTEEIAAPGLTRLFVTTAAEATAPGHPAHGYFQERYRLMEEHNAEAVQSSIDSGELRPDVNARALGRALVAIGDGFKQQWLLAPEFDVLDHTRRHFGDLLRGISADGRGLPDLP